MKRILLACLLACAAPGMAQFNDDFTDGDFTQNPAWIGNASVFSVNAAKQLQLLNPSPSSSNTSYLSTNSIAINSGAWEFYVQMNFNPSTSNYARFYVCANGSDLTAPMNGYYVEIGAGTDQLRFGRSSNGSNTALISSAASYLDVDTVRLRVRLERDNVGFWTLKADPTGGTAFQTIGTATDAQFTSCIFSGWWCRYTSTRADKFFLDDVVVVGTGPVDATPPVLLSAQALSASQVRLSFNESLQPASVLPLSQYSVSNGIGNPVSAVLFGAQSIDLNLPAPIQSNQAYQISVSGVSDASGNPMAQATLPFAWVQVSARDVVFNEVYPDPSPSFGLPEFEYIELHNRTSLPLSLLGFTLTVGSSSRSLNGASIMPDSFLVIADPAAQGYFPAGTPVFYPSSWTALTNSGASLELKDSNGVMIDQLSYSLAYYNDPAKDDGGYSLERVNPTEFCSDAPNWRASLAGIGGTPGSQNSVFSTASIPFSMSNAVVETPTQALLTFSKNIDASTVQPSDFQLSGGIGSPISTVQVASSQLRLVFSAAIPSNQSLWLRALSGVSDCAGNPLTLPDSIELVNYSPAPFEILIHEIMAKESDPVQLPPTEYIELKNTNSFAVPMTGWVLKVGSSSYTLSAGILPANGYGLLIRESNVGYFTGMPVFAVGSMSLTNAGTTLSLHDPSGRLIHTVSYSESWHENTVKRDNGGWSLEMRDSGNPCAGSSNWTSSVDLRGGTPGEPNSVSASNPDALNPFILRSGTRGDTAYLYFSEPLHPNSVDILQFSLPGSPGFPLETQFEGSDLSTLRLVLANGPNAGEVIWLKANGLEDCAGNLMGLDSVRLAQGQAPDSAWLLINEVLCNPKDSGVDFVEIYHNGIAAVDLSTLYLGSADTLLNTPSSPKSIHSLPLTLFPDQHLVLSTDPARIQSQYTCPDVRAFWKMESLASYNNSDGVVSLSNISLQLLDVLAYNEADFHFALLKDFKGVSMERISPALPTQQSMNWTSAAQTVGYATPGYRNSQYGEYGSAVSDFELMPDIFSPNNDGFDDQMGISYTLDKEGYMGSITVYDAVGRSIRSLLPYTYLAKQGNFIWNGLADDGSKARTGIYIVVFDLFHPEGRQERLKKACSVAAGG